MPPLIELACPFCIRLEQAKHSTVLQLRADVVPKTAENFRCLCTGTLGHALLMIATQLLLRFLDLFVELRACNELALPIGEKGQGRSGKPLSFKGSSFHRVIPKFMCQVRSDEAFIGLLLSPGPSAFP